MRRRSSGKHIIAILEALKEEGETCIRRLSHETQIPYMRLRPILGLLASDGCIRVEQEAPRKHTRITISKKGEKILEKLRGMERYL